MTTPNPLAGTYNGHRCIDEACGRFGAFGFSRPGGPTVWACNDPDHQQAAEARSLTAQFPVVAAETEERPF